MTALDHPTHAIAASTRAVAAVTRVASGLGLFLRSFVNRRELNRLGELTDYQLADIGLARSDLVVAQNAPIGTDPTARLGSLARQRYWTEYGARRVC